MYFIFAILFNDDTYFSLFDGILNVNISLRVGDGVPNTNTVTFEKKPVVHNCLDIAVQFSCNFKSQFQIHNMGQRTRRGPKGLFAENATD